MSHHVSASPSNPTGAVEVVRAPSSAATTAPVDGGGAAGTGAGVSAPASTTPVSTEVTGTATAPVAGQSGTPGANLPVDGLQQASTTIEGAKADLARTAGAERRLDGFDGVGGGDGGGGENADAGQENANNAEGAVAQATADMNVSDQDGGVGGLREMGEQELTTTADQNANQSVETAAGQSAAAGADKDPRSAV